jgi:hypothetical protein
VSLFPEINVCLRLRHCLLSAVEPCGDHRIFTSRLRSIHRLHHDHHHRIIRVLRLRRRRDVGGDDAHQIRTFVFAGSGIVESAPPTESPRKPTYGSTAIANTSIDFQLSVEMRHGYGGYAKELPSLFTMAARMRCFDLEDTCGSYRAVRRQGYSHVCHKESCKRTWGCRG